MTSGQVRQKQNSESPLAEGTVVSGRFKVEKQVTRDALGAIIRSEDQKTNRPISLRLLPRGIVDQEGMKILRSECRIASSLSHECIASTYGVGTASGRAFVATEWVEGRPLTDVVKAHRTASTQMSLRMIYSIIEKVCNACTAAHTRSSHGALSPAMVWVADDESVRVTGFGLARALLATRGDKAFPEEDRACFAPEVKGGGIPTAAADVFGIGALVYTLLTLKSPADGFVPPSQVHPDATPALDQVLLMCLAADPASRFASPDEVRGAFKPLVDRAPKKTIGADLAAPERIPSVPPAAIKSDSFDIDIDIDIDGDSVSGMATESGADPQVGARVSMDQAFRPLDPLASPRPNVSPQGPTEAPVTTSDLGAAMKKITENDAYRWMVDKGGLSHGPFNGRELIENIVKGEILEDHLLHNTDTGDKKPIAEWPEFRDFVEQRKLREREEARKAAIDDAERTERRSGAWKLIAGGTILLALVAATVVFFMTRETSEQDQVADADVGDLYAMGDIELEGTAGILEEPRSGGRRSGMRGGGMGGTGFAGSYEDAMARAVDIGDATGSGGQGRLSGSQVSGVMNRHVNRIYQRCAAPENARGGRLGNVTIDIAIAGNGQVMGVSARNGSGGFKSCVRQVVRSVRFPTFGAPRMGARYSFDASP